MPTSATKEDSFGVLPWIAILLSVIVMLIVHVIVAEV